MKNLFKLFLVLFASLLVFSCRDNGAPEDIHEHEGIEKLTVTLKEEGNASNTQVISYIGGVADKNIVLENGKTYNVSLDFFHAHDDHYDSILSEIVADKDEHFITYEFAGVEVNVTRAATDEVRTDGNKLGLKTVWTVATAPSNAKVGIKLYHKPTTVNQNSPSETNQQGSVTGGETDLNALITIE